MKEYEYKFKLIDIEKSLIETLNKEGRTGWRAIQYDMRINGLSEDIKNPKWVREVLFEREKHGS